MPLVSLGPKAPSPPSWRATPHGYHDNHPDPPSKSWPRPGPFHRCYDRDQGSAEPRPPSGPPMFLIGLLPGPPDSHEIEARGIWRRQPTTRLRDLPPVQRSGECIRQDPGCTSCLAMGLIAGCEARPAHPNIIRRDQPAQRPPSSACVCRAPADQLPSFLPTERIAPPGNWGWMPPRNSATSCPHGTKTVLGIGNDLFCGLPGTGPVW